MVEVEYNVHSVIISYKWCKFITTHVPHMYMNVGVENMDLWVEISPVVPFNIKLTSR